MKKPNFNPKLLPGTRLATKDDFRENGQLILDIQYWEYFYSTGTWDIRFTEVETDRMTLKAKILQGYVIVNDPPEVFNQRPIEEILKILNDAA